MAPCPVPRPPPSPPLLPPPQGYYRRGDANFAMGKFKAALKDLRTVGGGWGGWGGAA